MRRNLILLLVAIALGAAAAVAAGGYLKGARTDIVTENEPVKVFVVQKDIPKGVAAARLETDGYIKLEAVPERFVSKDSLSSLRPVENQVLAVPVSAGEQLTAGRFTFAAEAGLSYTVPDGMVAVSLEVDDVSSVAGMLRPGDNVIVFASFKPEGGLDSARTETLIPKTRVLAVGQTVGAVDGSTTKAPSGGGGLVARVADAALYKAVTVAVTAQDAARIVFARQNGQLQLALIPQTAPDGAPPKPVVYGEPKSSSARAVME